MKKKNETGDVFAYLVIASIILFFAFLFFCELVLRPERERKEAIRRSRMTPQEHYDEYLRDEQDAYNDRYY